MVPLMVTQFYNDRKGQKLLFGPHTRRRLGMRPLEGEEDVGEGEVLAPHGPASPFLSFPVRILLCVFACASMFLIVLQILLTARNPRSWGAKATIATIATICHWGRTARTRPKVLPVSSFPSVSAHCWAYLQVHINVFLIVLQVLLPVRQKSSRGCMERTDGKIGDIGSVVGHAQAKLAEHICVHGNRTSVWTRHA